MRQHFFLGLLFTTFLATPVLAGTMGPVERDPDWLRVVTISLGPDFISKVNGQTISLLPPVYNHYTTSDSYSSILDGGVFLGVERSITSNWGAQIGVAGHLTSSATIKGYVWQFALPQFDNLTYDYRVKNERLMASGKLLSMQLGRFHPYVSGEIGVSSNKARDYQERPLIPEVLSMVPFKSNKQTSFAYGAGIGMDYQVKPQLRLGAGWQWANLGQVSLGASPAAFTSETLKISHLYANQLRFQLTYSF